MNTEQLAALSIEAWSQGGTVMQLMASAEENAATTVYEEKTAPESELAAITIASLQTGLSYCDDAAAGAWFVARGITF